MRRRFVLRDLVLADAPLTVLWEFSSSDDDSVPRSGTKELSPALQRWVGGIKEPSPSGTREKHVLRLARDDRRLRVAIPPFRKRSERMGHPTVLCNDRGCLLYTSDAADEEDSVDLGGR